MQIDIQPEVEATVATMATFLCEHCGTALGDRDLRWRARVRDHAALACESHSPVRRVEVGVVARAPVIR